MKDLRVGDLIYVSWGDNFFLVTNITEYNGIITIWAFDFADCRITGVSADSLATFTDGQIISRFSDPT